MTIHIFALRWKDETRRSSQLRTLLKRVVVNRTWKKFQARTGFDQLPVGLLAQFVFSWDFQISQWQNLVVAQPNSLWKYHVATYLTPFWFRSAVKSYCRMLPHIQWCKSMPEYQGFLLSKNTVVSKRRKIHSTTSSNTSSDWRFYSIFFPVIQ